MSLFDSFFGRERIATPGLARIGIGGFSLFARVRERTTLVASAPTAYVEDGSPMNDHIIRSPEKLSIEGVVGDVYRGPDTTFLQVTPLTDTLGAIEAYIPRVTSFQRTIMDGLRNTMNAAKSRINDLLSAGNQANSFLGNLDSASKPLGEQFVDAMENIYYGNQLVSIDMPYRRYDSMVLTSVVIERDNTQAAISFSIEAEKFRIAETTFVEVQRVDKNPSPATGGQTKDVKDIGTQTGEKRDTSFLGRYTPFSPYGN